jgi:hypothetical protein
MIGDHPVGDHFVAAADNLLKLAFLLPGIIFTGSVGPGCFRCSKSGAENRRSKPDPDRELISI